MDQPIDVHRQLATNNLPPACLLASLGKGRGALRSLELPLDWTSCFSFPGLAFMFLSSGFMSDFASDNDSMVHTQAGVCFVLPA